MKRGLSLGRLLRGVRAGERHLAWNHESTRSATESIVLGSADFDDGATMPPCSAGPGVGDNLSPELHWSGVPREARQSSSSSSRTPPSPSPAPTCTSSRSGSIRA